MAASGTLVEYLALCLDTVCGHWLRSGEIVRNGGVLTAAVAAKAQAADPVDPDALRPMSRFRGLGMISGGMPSATLAEEILTEGPGQIRALISCGGNPVAALPDHDRTVRAMRSLDLLVQVDPYLSQTAQLADYVIAPHVSLETAGSTQKLENVVAVYATGYGFDGDEAFYTEAVLEPPDGSEVIEDWMLFYGLAARLGLQLAITPAAGLPVPLDMHQQPTSDELIETMCRGSRVPLAEVRRRRSPGRLPPAPTITVAPKDEGWTGRLDVGNAQLMALLTQWSPPHDQEGTFRLLCRRMPHVVNSSFNLPVTNRGRPHNPAFLNPDDMAACGLVTGDSVTIESAHGSITALVAPDPALRPGTVSMSFGFGGHTSTDNLVEEAGSTVQRLLSPLDQPDPFSGQPTMSGLAVVVRPLTEPSQPELSTLFQRES
jgi:anaerobic selenocysteine-containing dehydrogenase